MRLDSGETKENAAPNSKRVGSRAPFRLQGKPPPSGKPGSITMRSVARSEFPAHPGCHNALKIKLFEEAY